MFNILIFYNALLEEQDCIILTKRKKPKGNIEEKYLIFSTVNFKVVKQKDPFQKKVSAFLQCT